MPHHPIENAVNSVNHCENNSTKAAKSKKIEAEAELSHAKPKVTNACLILI
jgi:hypothetical protein